jgi:hypothetical protein
MKATIATPAQAVNLRGMQTRAAFHGEGLAKPMTWILRYYPEMSEEEKSLLRFWLLGRAPASMPEYLMRKAESALQRLKAA